MQSLHQTPTDPELIRKSLHHIDRGTENADVSAERLIHAGPPALDAAIEHMRSISTRLRRMERITSFALINGGIMLTALNVFCALYTYTTGVDPISTTTMVGIWSLYLAALVMLPLKLASLVRKRNRVLDVVARFDDIRVLGPVTELLERDRQAAGQALIRLLPRVRPEDRETLLPSHISQLNQILTTLALKKGEKELGIAVVTALGKVGDHRSLGLLERLAESRSKKYAELREAAIAALPQLRKHLDHLRLGKALLRPSQSPTDELLHPAGSSHSPTDDALLRPDKEQH